MAKIMFFQNYIGSNKHKIDIQIVIRGYLSLYIELKAICTALLNQIYDRRLTIP